MKRETRVRLAKLTLIASLIGWPLSHVWVYLANGFDPFEQFVLALSWFAITITAWDVITTSQVYEENA